MATRFYLQGSTGTLLWPSPLSSLAADASWEVGPNVRVPMATYRRNTLFDERGVTKSVATNPFDCCIYQAVSGPLRAQTIAGTVKAIFRARESAATADMRAQLLIRVVSRDGSTVRGTLLAHDASALSNEFIASLPQQNRKFPLNWTGSGAALSSLAVQEGDRLVVEVGYRSHTATTGVLGYVQVGDSASTDCAENETDQLLYNPWIEFSQDLLFEESTTRDRSSGEDYTTQFGGSSRVSSKAMTFDGVDEYITLGNVLGFDRYDAFSIACWVKWTSASYRTIIGKMNTSGQGWELTVAPDGTPYGQLYIGVSDYILRSTAHGGYNDGGWHHVCVTYDGSGLSSGFRMYMEGADCSGTPSATTLSTSVLNTSACSIAGRASTGGSCLAGSIDELSVYNKALSASEVAYLYGGNRPDSPGAPSNLVAWWRMGDWDVYPTALDSGPSAVHPTVMDSSGNNYTGTMTNMEVGDIVADVPGGAFATKSLLFGGTDEYVTMGNVLAFERTDPFSFSLWFKTTGVNNSFIVKLDNDATFTGYGLGLTSAGTFRLYLVSDYSAPNTYIVVTTTATYNDGLWHHLVVTYDGSSLASGVTIYVDDAVASVVVGTDNLTTSMVGTNPLGLGARVGHATPYALVGNLDEVAVYTKELSSTEVSWLYNKGVPRDLKGVGAPSNLTAWWRLGEGAYPGTMTNMEAGDIVEDVPLLPPLVVGEYARQSLLDSGSSSNDVLEGRCRQRQDFISQLGTPSPAYSGGEYVRTQLVDSGHDVMDWASVNTPQLSLSSDGVDFSPQLGGVTYYIKRARDLGSGTPVFTEWVSTDINSDPPTSPPVGPWGEIKIVGEL